VFRTAAPKPPPQSLPCHPTQKAPSALKRLGSRATKP
jgi:hypothetical protein